MSREWALDTRRNGCGTRQGFNEIIPCFPWILMVFDLGEVFRDFLMSLSALLFQYSVSLMSTSMAFVWEDKTPESKRGRNTLTVSIWESGLFVSSTAEGCRLHGLIISLLGGLTGFISFLMWIWGFSRWITHLNRKRRTTSRSVYCHTEVHGSNSQDKLCAPHCHA